MVRDLTYSSFVKLRDVNGAIDAAIDAVEHYRTENPGLFKSGTDFITKSLGFVNKEFRARHPFSQRTLEAFSKYEHLVRSGKTPEVALDQEVVDDPPKAAVVEPARERKPGPRGRFLRHPTIVAAIIGAIGAIAALSPWLLEQVSVGDRIGRTPQPAGPTSATPGNPSPGPATSATPSNPSPGPATSATPDSPNAEEFQECGDCPLMVAVRAGRFTMGSTEGDENERPPHLAIVPAFAIGRYEVTFNEWDACVADGGCKEHRPDDERWGRGRRPVINVSWKDATAYVEWLRKVTGAPYRLPSEAEWEYAARAGMSTRYWWGGDNPTPEQANFGSNVRKTTEVGSYPANPLGLHDMNGNVWEWVGDCWNGSYEAPARADDGSFWTRSPSD